MADVTDLQHEKMIEDRINEKGMNSPRIKPKDVDDFIDEHVPAQYHVFPGSNTTVCLLTLNNGYTLVGESACVSPENFDPEIGQEVAYKDARNKIWPLLGFLLNDKMARGEI